MQYKSFDRNKNMLLFLLTYICYISTVPDILEVNCQVQKKQKIQFSPWYMEPSTKYRRDRENTSVLKSKKTYQTFKLYEEKLNR